MPGTLDRVGGNGGEKLLRLPRRAGTAGHHSKAGLYPTYIWRARSRNRQDAVSTSQIKKFMSRLVLYLHFHRVRMPVCYHRAILESLFIVKVVFIYKSLPHFVIYKLHVLIGVMTGYSLEYNSRSRESATPPPLTEMRAHPLTCPVAHFYATS